MLRNPIHSFLAIFGPWIWGEAARDDQKISESFQIRNLNSQEFGRFWLFSHPSWPLLAKISPGAAARCPTSGPSAWIRGMRAPWAARSGMPRDVDGWMEWLVGWAYDAMMVWWLDGWLEEAGDFFFKAKLKGEKRWNRLVPYVSTGFWLLVPTRFRNWAWSITAPGSWTTCRKS